MKNLTWKNIRLIALILALVGFMAVLKTGNREFLNTGTPKTVEIRNIQIGGWKEGQKQWVIKTQSAWAYQNLDQSTVEEVLDGKFYDQGKIILEDLKAKLVHANSQTGRLQADGNISATLLRYPKQGPQRVKIFCGQLLFDANLKQTQLKKDVRLYEGQNKIYTQQALLDHQKRRIDFEQGILFRRGNDTLKAPHLSIREETQQYHFTGGVYFLRPHTQFYSQEVISIIENEQNQARLIGKIKIRQRGQIVLGENGFYDEALGQLRISQNAELLTNGSGTLPEESDLAKLSRQNIRQILENETYLKARQLLTHLQSGDVEAAGNVIIRQKNQQARAQNAYLDQANHLIRLSENAELQKSDGSWIKANEVWVNTQTHEFTAKGEVETTILQNEK